MHAQLCFKAGADMLYVKLKNEVGLCRKQVIAFTVSASSHAPGVMIDSLPSLIILNRNERRSRRRSAQSRKLILEALDPFAQKYRIYTIIQSKPGDRSARLQAGLNQERLRERVVTTSAIVQNSRHSKLTAIIFHKCR